MRLKPVRTGRRAPPIMLLLATHNIGTCGKLSFDRRERRNFRARELKRRAQRLRADKPESDSDREASRNADGTIT